MKKITCLLMFLGMMSCQRDDIDARDLQLLEGGWERIAYRIDQSEWVADSTSGKASLLFRADGVPLDGNGFGFCCPPQKLLINGRLATIEQKSPVTPHPACQLIRCRPCETVEIQVTRESMLWLDCYGGASRYRRLP